MRTAVKVAAAFALGLMVAQASGQMATTVLCSTGTATWTNATTAVTTATSSTLTPVVYSTPAPQPAPVAEHRRSPWAGAWPSERR